MGINNKDMGIKISKARIMGSKAMVKIIMDNNM